jgi:heme/copper-type cytochrome/quinol oxidase subunit 3
MFNNKIEKNGISISLFTVKTVKLGRGGLNKFNKFHLLKPSIWPFLSSLAVSVLVFGLLFWFYSSKFYMVFFGLIEVLICMFFWWQDVSYESGEQTEEVSRGLKIGMALFIVSEVMFFFSFFWAFFHVSLVPGLELGGIWPPIGLAEIIVDTWGVPLLNTFLLLSSGVTITGAHHAFLSYFHLEKLSCSWELKDFSVIKTKIIDFEELIDELVEIKEKVFINFYLGVELMILTVILAIIFTILQGCEYVESLIRISDSVYGSTFFVMTGFHGLHVIVGTIFLITCLSRIVLNQFYYKNSVGLECAIWYWHFVDVVRLFLFVSIYMWGNDTFEKQTFKFATKDDIWVALNLSKADFAQPDTMLFQDPATVLMESIVDLHHNIMAFLIFIFIFVSFMMLNCVFDIEWDMEETDLELKKQIYEETIIFHDSFIRIEDL